MKLANFCCTALNPWTVWELIRKIKYAYGILVNTQFVWFIKIWTQPVKPLVAFHCYKFNFNWVSPLSTLSILKNGMCLAQYEIFLSCQWIVLALNHTRHPDRLQQPGISHLPPFLSVINILFVPKNAITNFQAVSSLITFDWISSSF